jgi:hypothetical protein
VTSRWKRDRRDEKNKYPKREGRYYFCIFFYIQERDVRWLDGGGGTTRPLEKM